MILIIPGVCLYVHSCLMCVRDGGEGMCSSTLRPHRWHMQSVLFHSLLPRGHIHLPSSPTVNSWAISNISLIITGRVHLCPSTSVLFTLVAMRGTPGTQLIHIFLRCWLTLNKFQIPKVSIKSQPCLGNRAHSHTAAETRGGMVATPGVRPSGHLEGPVEQGRTFPVPSCRTSQRYPAPCLGKHLTQAPSHDTAQSCPGRSPSHPRPFCSYLSF